ncbi:TPA: hypothetical protein QFE13_002497 [Enterococcus faecium]
MKKTIISLVSISVLASIGGGMVFADTTPGSPNPPAIGQLPSEQTPITANLTLPADKNVTPPSVPTPGPGEPAVVPPTVVQQNGRGIVYYPGAQSVSATLQENGAQDIKLQSQIHVGVKDTLRQKDAWTLTATLNWGSNDLNGVTIKGSNATVTENDGSGKLSPITNDLVTTPNADLTISDTPSTIMETTAGKMKNGVYDYQVNDFKINIPDASTVPAGSYTGTIDWNLSIVPNP